MVYALVRDREGRVTGRLRLDVNVSECFSWLKAAIGKLTQAVDETTVVMVNWAVPVPRLADLVVTADLSQSQCLTPASPQV